MVLACYLYVHACRAILLYLFLSTDPKVRLSRTFLLFNYGRHYRCMNSINRQIHEDVKTIDSDGEEVWPGPSRRSAPFCPLLSSRFCSQSTCLIIIIIFTAGLPGAAGRRAREREPVGEGGEPR